MLNLERGPLDLIDAAALRTFAPAPSFSALAAAAVQQLGDHDTGLAFVGQDVGVDLPVDVDDAFASTVTPAHAALVNEATYAPGSPLVALVAQGDNNDVIRQSVLSILPQPDSEFPTSFQTPPAPPGGGELPTPDQRDAEVRDVVDRRLAERGVTGGSPTGGSPTGGSPTGGSPTGGGDPVREAIRQLYLELLGRDPDPQGWDNATIALEIDGQTLDWLREQILASSEYHEKHPGAGG